MSDRTSVPNDLAELAPGRGFTETTTVPDWIVLSASSPAVKLYLVLCMRLNRKRRDRKVWPGRAKLAVMLDVKKTDTVTGYLQELETIGAIDIGRTNTVPSHNVYRINHSPPDTYTGPFVIEDWDHNPDNRRAEDVILAAEKDKRERAKAKQRAARESAATRKPQAKPDTRSNGYQGRPARTASTGTRSNGYLETRSTGDLDTRSIGSEPLGVSLGSSVTEDSDLSTATSEKPCGERSEATPPAVAQDTERQEKIPDPSSKIENQEDPEDETAEFVKSNAHWPTLTVIEEALLDEVRAVAPLWPSRMLRKVIGSRVIREVARHDAELVRRAFLIGASDSKTVPMRLWHVESCPHWKRAARELAAERSPKEPLVKDPKPDEAGTKPSQLLVIPAPSRMQDSPIDQTPTLGKAEALALAAKKIVAGQEKMKAAVPAARSHAENMAILDQKLAEASGA